MRKLTPQRRAAAICAACAAIIPSTTLLRFGSHSNAAHFTGGLVVGLACTLSMATLFSTRRACS